jgi:hypothetical protein
LPNLLNVSPAVFVIGAISIASIALTATQLDKISTWIIPWPIVRGFGWWARLVTPLRLAYLNIVGHSLAQVGVLIYFVTGSDCEWAGTGVVWLLLFLSCLLFIWAIYSICERLEETIHPRRIV